MRKYLLGYPVWQARMVMLEWVMAGIKENLNPAHVEVAFYMDEWTKGDRDMFKARMAEVLPEFRVTVDGGSHEIREIGCHNWFISRLMDGDQDCLIVPQDDVRLNGATMLADLDRVLDQYGTNIGYIGMREGYGCGYRQMMASPFDAKIAGPGPVEELPIGTWRECEMINPGPLVYPRSTVERIGSLDVSYHNWHWWSDYALRAQKHGLKNGLLSINAAHEKSGEYRASRIIPDRDDWVARDLSLLNRRWKPVMGHNVI